VTAHCVSFAGRNRTGIGHVRNEGLRREPQLVLADPHSVALRLFNTAASTAEIVVSGNRKG
jgi:hypothetical protein